MKTLKTANFYRRAFRNKMNVRDVPLRSVTEEMKKYYDENNEKEDFAPCANGEAIEFYFLNHIVGDILSRKQEFDILTEKEVEFLDRYFDICNSQARRMFYYLLAICTRESRHTHSSATFEKDIEAKYGKEVKNFHNEIRNIGSTPTFQRLMNNAPDSSLGNFTSHLENVFFKGCFTGGYGGEKWGEVAKVLNNFVHGDFSPELLIDAAFNLSHNNGPIFNKGMFYKSYSSDFIKILDVQRSGQIPTYVMENNLNSYFPSGRTSVVQEILNYATSINAEIINKYVDYYLVEVAGAVKSYSHEKEQQKGKHGLPDSASKAVKELEEKKAKQKAEQDAKMANMVDFGFGHVEKLKVERE